MNGTKEFDASREVVWSVIDDPVQMAGLMPGVESLEIKDERRWQAKVKIPLGIGGLKMTIDFEKVEERPLEFASMNAKGKGVGAMMNMTTSFTLAGEGEHTSMAWAADVKIAGPVGSMGQGSCSRSSSSRWETCSPRSRSRSPTRRRLPPAAEDPGRSVWSGNAGAALRYGLRGYTWRVSWPWIVLLAIGVGIVVASEWPRFERLAGADARRLRDREKRKANLQVVSTDDDEFVRSVQADLEALPTTEERETPR